eukprot:4015275-Pyramimonas_sp.AAC.1
MCITALRTYAALLPFFDVETETCNDLPQLCGHARLLQQAAIDDELHGLEACAAEDLSEEAWIQHQIARFRRKRELWSKLRRRVYLVGVLDPDGSPCGSLEASGKALADHWSEVFKATPVDRELWGEIIGFVSPVHDLGITPTWFLTRPSFHNMLLARRNIAPGPGGVPYSCWQGSDALDILHD